MFAKILQNPDLSAVEQKEVIKGVVQTNLKKNLPEVRLQLTHNYDKLKPVLLNNWKYALRIGLSLINWQTARQIMSNKRQQIPFDLLTSIVSSDQQIKVKSQHILTQLPKTYPQPWKGIILLVLGSQIIVNKLQSSHYDWFIPSFVRLSATVIQSYLIIKNEPTKSTGDRIESDLVLVQNCQKWVEQTYSRLFKSLQPPQTESEKQIVLCGLSQVVGALCQSDREGNLDHDRLMRLLQCVKQYIFSGYRVEEVEGYFVGRLRQLKYNNPIKKLEIPEVYKQESDLSSEGICWIIAQFVKQSTTILSKSKQLSLLLLAYAEILPSPLQLRHQISILVKQLFAQTLPSPSFETNYPLALLLFKIHHYSKQDEAYYASKMAFEEWAKTKVNRLRRLLSLNLGPLNVDKIRYVFSHIGEEELSLKQSVLLAKAVEFDFTDETVGNLVASVFTKLAQHHGQAGKQLLREIIQREKANKRNVQLCDRIVIDV